ncbi:MAG: DUF1569 domain-containing protein [Phycisphaeraceae bacterium]|nr:DUF1569 domain-containing protein [Phycisphaeraceae bacterium]
MSQPVNTKTASRREVRYQGFDDILKDLDRLEAADREGVLIRHGNWTLGQNTHHLADTMEQSLDGFRFTSPLPLRVLFRILRPMVLSRPFPKGIKLTGSAATLIPDTSITSEQGLGELRRQIQRVQDGERFTQASPIFGKLSHEQWVNLHLKHAELHLGFLDPGADAGA